MKIFLSGGKEMDDKYNNVGLWNVQFYRLDDEGNPLRDNDDKVIIYSAPDEDFEWMMDYIKISDLQVQTND